MRDPDQTPRLAWWRAFPPPALFGVFTSYFFRFAEGMVLGKISVARFIARQCQSDARRDQARCQGSRVWFSLMTVNEKPAGPASDASESLPAAGNELAVRRKNRGDANDIASRNARAAERELKTRKALAVLADSLGQENFLRDERHISSRVAVPPFVNWKKRCRRKLTSMRSDVNGFPMRFTRRSHFGAARPRRNDAAIRA